MIVSFSVGKSGPGRSITEPSAVQMVNGLRKGSSLWPEYDFLLIVTIVPFVMAQISLIKNENKFFKYIKNFPAYLYVWLRLLSHKTLNAQIIW